MKKNEITHELPHHGRWRRAKEKKGLATVVFVHHFGGHRASVKHHQDFLNELGFDTVSFTLSRPEWPGFLKKTLLNDFHYHLRELWQKEITEVLDAVSGPKIVFSFSFPSAPALLSIGDRHAKDIQAWICDGGPFLMPITCFWNYLIHIEPTPLWLRPTRLAMGLASIGAWNLARDLHRSLSVLPNQFPILSIRSWQDPLVPSQAIDMVFETPSQVRLEILTLPEAGHIDGLQKFPEEYKPRLTQFLTYVCKGGVNE